MFCEDSNNLCKQVYVKPFFFSSAVEHRVLRYAVTGVRCTKNAFYIQNPRARKEFPVFDCKNE
jgi:hypothetical protein